MEEDETQTDDSSGNNGSEFMTEAIGALKECRVYKNYLKEKENIRKYPELKGSIDRLREINGLIQNDLDFETEENLTKEYEWLCSDGRVRDFMQAELDYCRFFQEIQAEMAKEMDL